VNCHANTDTSDLLGGLRPLRSRSSILLLMVDYAQQLEQIASSLGTLSKADIPSFESMNEVDPLVQDKVAHMVMNYAKHVESMLRSIEENDKMHVTDGSGGKRRKLEYLSIDVERIKDLITNIRRSFKRFCSLFEWVDGPLLSAMKTGRIHFWVHIFAISLEALCLFSITHFIRRLVSS